MDEGTTKPVVAERAIATAAARKARKRLGALESEVVLITMMYCQQGIQPTVADLCRELQDVSQRPIPRKNVNTAIDQLASQKALISWNIAPVYIRGHGVREIKHFTLTAKGFEAARAEHAVRRELVRRVDSSILPTSSPTTRSPQETQHIRARR